MAQPQGTAYGGDYSVDDIAGSLFTITYRDKKIRGKDKDSLAPETLSVRALPPSLHSPL